VHACADVYTKMVVYELSEITTVYGISDNASPNGRGTF